MRADEFEPARRALQMLRARQAPLAARRSGRDGEPGRDQRVGYLEIAGQRQVDLVKHAVGLDLGALAMPLVLDALQLEEIALRGRRSARRARRACAASIVGADHGSSAKMTAGAPFGSSVSNRRSLALMIVLDRRVIVHVVAAEIGEAAGGELDAVEPALVEAMARRFHRGMGDAVVREFARAADAAPPDRAWSARHIRCGRARRRRSCRCWPPRSRPAPRSAA